MREQAVQPAAGDAPPQQPAARAAPPQQPAARTRPAAAPTILVGDHSGQVPVVGALLTWHPHHAQIVIGVADVGAVVAQRRVGLHAGGVAQLTDDFLQGSGMAGRRLCW